MDSRMEIIRHRRSVRHFSDAKLGEDLLEFIEQLINRPWKGPFDTEPTFYLLSLSALPEKVKGNLGSYGLIRGAQWYIVGKAEDSDEGIMDYGYCLEQIILEAHRMGLGTCWLGGTFKKSVVQEIMKRDYDMKPLEIIPAITPIGYGVSEKAWFDKTLQRVMKSDRRRAWEDLFKAAEAGYRPLKAEEAGRYKEALEAIRLGPSAVNLQPWRIYKEPGRSVFHLMMEGGHLLDMGIAMAHFECVAAESGIKGHWSIPGTGHRCLPEKLRWIATWMEEEGLFQPYE